MTITPEQLKSFSAYVPPPIVRAALDDPTYQPGGTWRTFHAVTAFADISGFTPLAEELATNGVRGAEELTSVLNQVFESLISTVEAHGGQVFKFGGDALSLLWPCQPENMRETLIRAVQAAFAMQDSMARFATVITTKGEFELKMKMGLSAGEVLEVHAGGVFGRWEYVLAGAPMENMSGAENHASADQVVLDETAWNLAQGHHWDSDSPPDPAEFPLPNTCHEAYIFGHQVAPGFYRATHLWGNCPPRPFEVPDWEHISLNSTAAAKIASILRDYIPGAIKGILDSGYTYMLAELKPMTVCFVGFSGIDYNNDPEAGPRLSNFMLDAQKMIYHYEGSVNKLAVGDKGSVLLVLFGAPPFFHEDDEVRGVACALALQKVAARHNLELRIGLTAGPLFAGPLGAPQRREYTVIGDTVNLAARLMQKASAGQVWVDHSVQSKASRYFEYEDVGLLSVKGKTEPRHVYIALTEKDQSELTMDYLISSQELTGRDKEIKVIDQLLETVWAGQGQILLLIAEAGVGKSRLAAEVVRRWITAGGVSHGGDCVSHGQKTPYLPWRGILSSVAGLSPRLPAEERIARLSGILNRLPPPVDADGSTLEDYWLERLPLIASILGLHVEDTDLTRNMPDELRRDNLFATIRAIILYEAQQRPTLVVLEDTHWSDPLSIDLALHVGSSLADQPILLMLVHRPLSQTHMTNTYRRLENLPNVTRMLLDDLDPAASLKLVQRKLGVDTLPEQLADLIRRKGQGNPFFIEELVNSLLSMGAIRVEDEQCIVGDLSSIDLPDTVQKVVLARIDRLPEPEKNTLKIAAAIGRNFQRDILEAVHPWINPGNTITQQLERLQAEDFTRQEVKESDLDFLFKHVITQEVAYETMLYAQRRQLHAMIGQALEDRYQNNEKEVINLLAYHYSRSDNREKALYYLSKAAKTSLDEDANGVAIDYFSEALMVAVEQSKVAAQFDLLAGREKAYDRLGNRTAQEQDLTQMTQLAVTNENLPQQIQTGNRRVKLANNLGDYEQAVSLAEQVLQLATQAEYPAWRAKILTNLGVTYWRQGEYQSALEVFQEALKINGHNKDEQLKATALNYLGLIHTQFAEYSHARQDYQNALRIYRTLGERSGECSVLITLGLLESNLGRYEQAHRAYTQALSLAQTVGDRLREGISLNTLGQVLTILGQFDDAETYLQRSLDIRRDIEDPRGEAFCLHDMGHLRLAQDDALAARTCFQQAATLRHKLGEQGNHIASLAGLAEAHLQNDDVETAYQRSSEVKTALEGGSGSGEYPPQNMWWTHARICQATDRPQEAETSLKRAYQLITSKANQIRDPEFKRSYLQGVKTHAEIMAGVMSNSV